MKVFKLKCPYCSADLEAEDGLDSFYCKYCGGHILVEGMSDAAYKARVRVKEMDHEERLKDKELSHKERIREKELSHEERIKDKELTQERYIIKQKKKQRRNGLNNDSLQIIASLIAMLLLFGGVYFWIEHDSSQHEKDHQEVVAQLVELEAEIKEDISNGEYDSALLKAQKLRCDDNYSSEDKKAWDETRESLIDIINSKKRDVEISLASRVFRYCLISNPQSKPLRGSAYGLLIKPRKT